MKIFDLFENNNLTWHPEDSCDVWISPSGEVYDLGTESCHLHYIQENIDIKKYSIDLINDNWIKISNTKNTVSIESLSENLNKNKSLWIPVILEKAKIHKFDLKVSIIDYNRIVELKIPEELAKINLI